jgi:hypothetical protein
LDELALSQLIAKHQKDLSALRKKKGASSVPTKTGLLVYCWLHSYQHSHTGANCNIIANNLPNFNAIQKASTDPLKPPGGNRNVKN